MSKISSTCTVYFFGYYNEMKDFRGRHGIFVDV